MKLWQWLALLLSLLVLTGAFWYRYGHQKIRLATDAEIRAVVPADLLPGPPDAAAVKRFDQFNLLGDRIAVLNSGGEQTSDPDPSAMAKNAAIAGAAMKLAGQGLAQSDSEGLSNRDQFDLISNTLTLEAKLTGRAGDSRGCEKALAACLELARALRHAGGVRLYWDGYRSIDQTVAAVASCIRRGWLKPAELSSLIHELPESGPEDPDLMAHYRYRLQISLFNPDGLLKQIENESKVVPSVAPDDSLRAGNFDEIQTAQMLVDLTKERIENAARPWSDQLDEVDERIAKRAAELPRFPGLGVATVWAPYGFTKPRSPSLTERLKFIASMNAIPNSRALENLSVEVGAGGMSGRMYRAGSIKLANGQKVLRLLAAMWAYREEHRGVFPSNLGQLVTGRYLPQIPIDGFTDKPLGYDAKHHTISASETDTLWGFRQDISPLAPLRRL